MKTFYRSLSFLALFTLLFSQLVSIATPREDFLASRLLAHESDWKLEVEKNSALAKENWGADKPKSIAMQFIKKSLGGEYDGMAIISLVSVCVLLFSLLGWWRESRISAR